MNELSMSNTRSNLSFPQYNGSPKSVLASQPILLMFGALAWLLSIEIHLANDGIEHLRLTLWAQEVFVVSAARTHAYWITQWPVQLGIYAGWSDLVTFIRAYGLGISVLYILPWAIAYFRIRNTEHFARVSLLYLLALGAVSFPSAYLLGTEHQVIVPLVFLTGVLLSRFNERAVAWNVVAILLLFALCNTYETNLVPLGIFGLYLTYLLFTSRPGALHTWLLILGLAICIYGVSGSALSILNPRDVNHRTGFVQDIVVSLRNPAFLTFLFCAAAVLIFQRSRKAAAIVLAAAAIFQLYCLLTPTLYSDVAHVSFAARSLTVLLPGVLATLLLLSYVPRTNWWLGWSAGVLLGTSVMLLSWPFHDYQKQVALVASEHKGIVPGDTHGLGSHPASWPWTFPSMSIAWQAPCVGSVLLNPNSDIWQPYDPKTTSGFGSYVSFEPTFYSGNSDIRHCRAR